MTLYEMVVELKDLLDVGEIEDSEEVDCLDDSFDAARFIKNMFDHMSEDDDAAVEELTERQIATIHQLYDGYCNGEWESLDYYL